MNSDTESDIFHRVDDGLSSNNGTIINRGNSNSMSQNTLNVNRNVYNTKDVFGDDSSQGSVMQRVPAADESS